MSKQFTLKVNSSIFDDLDSLAQSIEDQTKDKLKDVADYLVEVSPVYSGAYVASHSAKGNNTSSRGRAKSSEDLERNTYTKAEGLANLYGDIDRFTIDDLRTVTFRNDSEHAKEVEYDHGHLVYQRTKDAFS